MIKKITFLHSIIGSQNLNTFKINLELLIFCQMHSNGYHYLVKAYLPLPFEGFARQ